MHARRFGWARFAVAASVLSVLPGVAAAAPGDPDPAYGGGDGVAEFDFGEVPDDFVVRTMHEVGGGKIVIVASNFDGTFATRRNADGSLDAGYGVGGFTELPEGFAFGSSSAVDTQGRLVLASGRNNDTGDARLARLTAGGQLDGTFGTGGVVVIASQSFPRWFAGPLVIQADDKIVVAAEIDDFAQAYQRTLRRFTTTGAPDGTWGTGGVVTLPAANATRDLAVAGDGSILAARSGGPNGTVERFSTTGSSLGSFGTSAVAEQVAVDASGRVVVAGRVLNTAEVRVERRSIAGVLDSTFDGDGVRSLALSSVGDETTDLLARASGVVDLGISSFRSPSKAIRLTGSGANDSTFAGDGSLDLARRGGLIATHSGGGVLVTSPDPANESSTRVLLVDAAGAPVNAFGGDGYADQLNGLRDSADGGYGLFPRPGGGLYQVVSNEDRLVLVATDTTGEIDEAFAADGVLDLQALLGDTVDTPMLVNVGPTGHIVVAGSRFDASTMQTVFQRLLADGSPDPAFGGGGGRIELNDFAAYGPLFITPTGGITAQGSSSAPATPGAVVLRLAPDGSPDTSLDGDGRVHLVPVGVSPSVVGVDTQGRILLARDDGDATEYRRLLANGAADPSWGFLGTSVLTDPPGIDAQFGRAIFEPTGAATVVGSSANNLATVVLGRLTPGGVPDPAFGNGGFAVVDPTPSNPAIGTSSVARQADGAFVVIGSALDEATHEYAYSSLRVLPSGGIDPSWNDGVPVPVPQIDGGTESIAIAPDGSTFVGGSFYDDDPFRYDAGIVKLQNPTAAPAGGGQVALPPARLLDTRNHGEGPCVSGAGGRNLIVVGRGGVPVGASAVILNVAVTGPTVAGFLTVWPAGEARPTASNLNYGVGQTIANTVVAKVGADGQVTIFAHAGCPQVVVDVVGWSAGGAPAAGGLTPLVPSRLLDTREAGQGPCLSGMDGRDLAVTGVGGVPASGVGAVVLNVTAVNPSGAGFLTVWPAGEARPTASNLNYVAGDIVPNTVLARVGEDGEVSLFAHAGCPDLVVDVVGWYANGAPADGGFAGLTPSRLLDTRDPGSGPCVAEPSPRNLHVVGVGGVPPNGVGAVALTVTTVNASNPGFLTVWPTGQTRPTTSNVNYAAGQVVPNTAIAKVSTGGDISIYAASGCPNVVVDVVGWYASVPAA